MAKLVVPAFGTMLLMACQLPAAASPTATATDRPVSPAKLTPPAPQTPRRQSPEPPAYKHSNCSQLPPATGAVTYAICVDTSRAAGWTAAPSAAQARPATGRTGATPNSVVVGATVPFPSGCNSAYATPSRTVTCIHETQLWHVFNLQDGQEEGSQQTEIWEYWQTDLSSLTIQHGFQLATRQATGFYATGTTISLVDPCVGGLTLTGGASCSATEQYSSPDPSFVMPNTYMANSWTETYNLGPRSRIAPDTVPTSALYVEVTPTAPPSPVQAEPAYLVTDDAWRCDQELTNISPGCVAPLFTPTVTFDAARNPLVGPVAHHMLVAQQQLPGHPGQVGSGLPLTRSTDPALMDRNNAVACGNGSSFVPDPPTDMTCDEYPFATTTQGASAGTGYSIAAVPKSANDSQGGLLSAGYNAGRILDGDNYYVAITVPDPRTGAVSPYQALTNQFTNYGNAAGCADWSGGDATNSILLPDGERAWFFSDSYLGSPSDRPSLFFVSTVHNSVVIQNGSSLRTITGGNTCHEHDSGGSFYSHYANSIATASDGGFYWTGDQQLVGSSVVKFYYHGVTVGNTFQNDYAAVASIPVSSLESASTLTVSPARLSCAVGGPPALWGSMTLDRTATDGYYYVYGISSTTPHQLYLARTTVGNLTNFAGWQFFAAANPDGTATWTSCGNANPLPINYATGGSVNVVNGSIWLIQDDYVSGSITAGTIAAHPSNTPWGFTARHIDLYTPPEGHYDFPYFYLVYEPRLQIGLSNPDGTSNVVLSYNVNTASVDTGCVSANARDASIYRPRFVEIPTSWFNSYDAPIPTGTPPQSGQLPVRSAFDGQTPLHNFVAPAGFPKAKAGTAGTSHQLQLAGSIGGVSDWFEHFGQPCPIVPTPTSLTAQTKPDGSATLGWTAPGTDIWFYLYQCDATAGSCASPACSSTPAGYSNYFAGLWLTTAQPVLVRPVTSSTNNGHTFDWFLCSFGAQNPNPIGTGGNGGASQKVAAKVTVAPPSQVTGLHGSRSGSIVSLAWNQVTYPSTAVYYTPLYWDVTTGQTIANATALQPTTSTSTKITVNVPGYTYGFAVKASNLGGYGPISSAVYIS